MQKWHKSKPNFVSSKVALNFNEAKVVSKIPPTDSFSSENYDNYVKNYKKYEYNFFSCIDQPVS